jgi:hypothetical protein
LPSFRAKKSFSTFNWPDLPVQKIDLGFIGGSLRRRAALEDARSAPKIIAMSRGWRGTMA